MKCDFPFDVMKDFGMMGTGGVPAILSAQEVGVVDSRFSFVLLILAQPEIVGS